jgi:SAM-dependent methyltransferase
VEVGEYDRLFELEELHWRMRGVRGLVRDALRRALPRDASGERPRLLDAGCGCGFGALSLGELADVVALDAHPQALAHCRRRGLRHLLRADVQAPPFRDASFDAVVSVDVLYHRHVADDAGALRELARICRPGGVVVVLLPAYERLRSSHDRAVHTARRYTKRRLLRLAEAAGLVPERLSYWNSAILPAAALWRLLRARGDDARSDLTPPPRLANGLLAAWLRVESGLALRVGLPFGLSVFGVLRKPGTSARA